MKDYLSSASLKSLAKGQLLGKYGKLIAIFLLHGSSVAFITILASSLIDRNSLLGNILYFSVTFIINLLSGLFIFGEDYVYLKVACNQPFLVSDLFWGFKQFPDKILKVQVVLAAISFICDIPTLFISPGTLDPDNAYRTLLMSVILIVTNVVNIVASLIFSQCYYLMLDFPDYSSGQLLKSSALLMRGNKGRLFYIQLSFIPWFLLGIMTCGIGLLWIIPYYQATSVNFYLDLIKKS